MTRHRAPHAAPPAPGRGSPPARRGPADPAGPVDPPAPPTPARGVSLVLDLPDASVADLVDVADTLHALALDLAPGARASTAVHLAPPQPRGPVAGSLPTPRENHVRHR